MPSSEVMKKFEAGTLHSGGPKGPVVKSIKQAIAIKASEADNEKAHGGTYESAPDRNTPVRRSRRRNKK